MTNIERNCSDLPKQILRVVQTNMERTFILRKFNENLVKNVMKACFQSLVVFEPEANDWSI